MKQVYKAMQEHYQQGVEDSKDLAQRVAEDVFNRTAGDDPVLVSIPKSTRDCVKKEYRESLGDSLFAQAYLFLTASKMDTGELEKNLQAVEKEFKKLWIDKDEEEFNRLFPRRYEIAVREGMMSGSFLYNTMLSQKLRCIYHAGNIVSILSGKDPKDYPLAQQYFMCIDWLKSFLEPEMYKKFLDNETLLTGKSGSDAEKSLLKKFLNRQKGQSFIQVRAYAKAGGVVYLKKPRSDELESVTLEELDQIDTQIKALFNKHGLEYYGLGIFI